MVRKSFKTQNTVRRWSSVIRVDPTLSPSGNAVPLTKKVGEQCFPVLPSI